MKKNGSINKELNMERKELLQQFDDYKRQFSLPKTNDLSKKELTEKIRKIILKLNGDEHLYTLSNFGKSIDIDTATIEGLFEVQGDMIGKFTSDRLTTVGKEQREKNGII